MQVVDLTEERICVVGTKYSFGWHELLYALVDKASRDTDKAIDGFKATLVIGDDEYSVGSTLPLGPAVVLEVRK